MAMKLNIKPVHPEKQPKICQIMGMFQNGELSPTAQTVDKINHGQISELIKKGVFQAKIGQTLPIFYGSNVESILLIGCGKARSLSSAEFRKIIIAAISALNAARLSQAICYLSELAVKDKALPWKIKHIAEAVWDGLYCFNLFKTEKEPATALQELTIHLPDPSQQAACEIALNQGVAIAHGVTFTKNLANLPSNICTPTFLAEQAKELAKAYAPITTKVLGEKEMQKLGMGALLAVSQGSAEEAQLICIEYKGTTKKQAPVALIGKGITFDSGGNSLKSPDSMIGMKYDMCGAATVLGTIKAAAELKLPLHVVGIVAAVENMPGGTAYKPEDILTSMSGLTIEVMSTDAEGRLVLSDALTYCELYQPAVVIDIATLTGAVVIALGHHVTGLLSNHDALAHDLLAAGEESGDRAWQLPLYDEYQEQIKSPFADMVNTGGRSAGAITAACFLSRFAKKLHWAHLDVAGTAAIMMGTSERMATGRPVPLLVQYLINRVTHDTHH
jgi:leucyl aminopeptidase